MHTGPLSRGHKMFLWKSPHVNVCRRSAGGAAGTGHEDVLKAVDLPIVGNEKCREMHRGNLLITSSKICAGGRRNEGVCEVKASLCNPPHPLAVA